MKQIVTMDQTKLAILYYHFQAETVTNQFMNSLEFCFKFILAYQFSLCPKPKRHEFLGERYEMKTKMCEWAICENEKNVCFC